MAESKPFGITLTKGSDILPDIYCDPCHDLEGHILQAAGFCENCSENLCRDCVFAHKRNKFTRNHQIQDNAGVPQQPSIKGMKPVNKKCHQHEEEVLQSYCRSCDKLCCKICQTVDHQSCNMQSLTTAAADIKDSQQLKDIEKKLNVLKKGYNGNLVKAENQSLNIEKLYTDAIKDIRKMQEKFKKVLAETEKRVETVKNEALKKMESISTTSIILVEQINKISSNLDPMQEKPVNEMLFISIKRAESQLKSFEDRLNQLDTDNTIKQYTFEPDEKLNVLLDQLKTLGELCFFNSTSSARMLKTPVVSETMLKTPVFINALDTQSANIRGSIMLPNQQIVLTDHYYKVKLVDTKQNKIVSELQLPGYLWDLTKIRDNEFAIACYNAEKIQFVSLSSDKLSMGREMPVDGRCFGIEYNDHQENLIVTFDSPPRIEILSLNGTILKRFEKDANGVPLFSKHCYTALNHDKTMIYVTDGSQNSVTLMTLNGDIKAIYKDKALKSPIGVCVNRSGIMYVVGYDSATVHHIVSGSDKLEAVLDQQNGLINPWTVTYCDAEDKLYVGQANEKELKIFKMK